MKTFVAFTAIVLAIIGNEAFPNDTPASPEKSGENATVAKEDSTASERPEDAVYCTLLCSEKLAADLHLTEEQTAELDKLQEQLKASILGGGVRSQQHGGLASGKARTLVKMTEARLSYFGGKIKDLLTPKQDQALNEFYSSGKLRPIEVAAAEVHDPKHGAKGKFFGQIVLVPHYEDAARNAEKSATQGVMHGAHSEGSYYRDSSSPKLGAASKPGKKENSSSDDDIDTLLTNLKKAGHERVKLTFALMPIEQRLPRAPNPAMAEALENVLLENATDNIRISAANSLGNWGRPESIPALQKAAKSSEPGVAEAAKKAIKALTGSSTPDGETNQSAEKPMERPAAATPPKRSDPMQPKPLLPAAREQIPCRYQIGRCRQT